MRENNVTKKSKILLIRIFIVIIFAAIIVLLIYFAFLETMPKLISVLKSGNEKDITAYLHSAGSIKGMLSLALLQIVQVVSIVLSSVPIEPAAGIVYGWLRSFIVCLFAATVAHALIFVAVRKMGANLEKWLPIKKDTSKLDFIINSDSPGYMVVVACIMPLVPGGLIPYMAVKTKLTTLRYIIAVFIGNFMPILIYCSIGHKILTGGYISAGILVLTLFTISLLLFKFRNQILNFLRKLLPILF
jgi:uncharacterized membrane protein YdjX (TVP38/TMEM64 family)